MLGASVYVFSCSVQESALKWNEIPVNKSHCCEKRVSKDFKIGFIDLSRLFKSFKSVENNFHFVFVIERNQTKKCQPVLVNECQSWSRDAVKKRRKTCCSWTFPRTLASVGIKIALRQTSTKEYTPGPARHAHFKTRTGSLFVKVSICKGEWKTAVFKGKQCYEVQAPA